MNRTLEQWRNCDPKAMAHNQSDAAKQFAFDDAKADILELAKEIDTLREQLWAMTAECDELRAENERLSEHAATASEYACEMLGALKEAQMENARLAKDAEQMATAILSVGSAMTVGDRFSNAGQDIIDSSLVAHKYAALSLTDEANPSQEQDK